MPNSEPGERRVPEIIFDQSDPFWEIYFGGRLIELERDLKGNYRGVCEIDIPGQFLPTEQPFSVARGVLNGHDYENDVRFWPEISDDYRRCLLEILVSPPMYDDTTPHRKQLETLISTYELVGPWSDDYSRLRENVVDALRLADAPIDRALQLIKTHQPTEYDYERYEETSDTMHLATERDLFIKAFGIHTTDPRILTILHQVVENEFVDETTASLAIWSIGRQNNKASIPPLINWLSVPRLTRHSVMIERALQYICSGSRLIPISYEEEPQYWSKITGLLPSTDSAWLALDATSVFWEKRLRCAVQLCASPPEEALALREDEVQQVRAAARSVSRSEKAK